MTYRQIKREADLLNRSAIYHALKMVKEGPVRPKQRGWAALMTMEGK